MTAGPATSANDRSDEATDLALQQLSSGVARQLGGVLDPLDAGKTMPQLAGGIVDNMMGPAPDPAGRALAIEIMGATPASTYRAAVHCLVAFDERANLGSIRVPTLCLAAEHDRNAPAPMMERMAGKIPRARYVCLAGLGHLPNLENAAAFNSAVLDFLQHALSPATT